MQPKVHHNNLLGNNKIFHHSAELLPPLPPLSSTLQRASQGIQSLLNSAGEGESTNEQDLGVSSEKIIEDYDGQRNIFSISSGQGARLDLSTERPGKRCGLQATVRMMFNEFCETTGLHGWKYLTRVSQINDHYFTDRLLLTPNILFINMDETNLCLLKDATM